jgi:hypothetical protein
VNGLVKENGCLRVVVQTEEGVSKSEVRVFAQATKTRNPFGRGKPARSHAKVSLNPDPRLRIKFLELEREDCVARFLPCLRGQLREALVRDGQVNTPRWLFSNSRQRE